MNKNQIISELAEEKRKLENIISGREMSLKAAPPGSVHIIKHGKGHQFYQVTDAAGKNGVYLKNAERNTAAGLIQKKYDQQVLAAAQKQACAIRRFLSRYEPGALGEIYALSSDIRKEYISPVELPDDEYASLWQSYEFEPKGFSEAVPEHYTNKGERVRSKSEVMIADALDQAGIPYRYECPLHLAGHVVHPDFTLLRMTDREELYWEHLGMMDDPEYCSNAIQKIRLYEKNGIWPGIKLILTMETSILPVNLAVIKQVINAYCT